MVRKVVSEVNDPSRKCGAARACWLVVLAALATGCGKTDPPAFHLDMIGMRDLPAHQQENISSALTAMFGTPDDPVVLGETGLDESKIRRAAGAVSSDQFGRRQGLYREHCAYCHGTTGDGAGPTAAILNPYPRDYRQGKFKFKSTSGASRPTDEDLRRIIENGIPGTAMPSFNLLAEDELDALVEYVKFLSIRGQTETKLKDHCYENLGVLDELPAKRELLVDETLVAGVVASWDEAKDQVIQPEPRAAVETGEAEKAHASSVAAGQKLFYGAKANCVKCHGDGALGDGQTTDYDDWTKANVEARKAILESVAAAPKAREDVVKRIDEIKANKELSEADKKTQLAEAQIELDDIDRLPEKLAVVDAALLPRNIRPRNLRLGIYRGGDRPLDLYRRIKTGIFGTPMPGAGAATPAGAAPAEGAAAGPSSEMTSAEIWALVDYVRSLPYEPMSRGPRPKAKSIGNVK